MKELIQVCTDFLGPGIKERETKPLVVAAQKLKCSHLSVVTMNDEGEEVIAKKKIRFIPAWKWLLQR